MEDSFNKILFKAKCIKPITFKLFFNLIKEPIRDIAFHLTKSGIESKHYDLSNNIHCILNLHENKFEDYYIDDIFTDGIYIGFNTINMVKILKGITVKDKDITFYIKGTPENFKFSVEINGSGNGCKLSADVDLIDIEPQQFNIPELHEYPLIIDINSKDLQGIVSQLKTVSHEQPRSQDIEIMFYNNLLSFTIPNNVYGNEIRIEKAYEIRPEYIPNYKNVIYAINIKLQTLINLTKTPNLSPNIIIYMNNNEPVFFEYKIGTLGEFIFGMNTIEDDDDYDE
jgi:hypothetical protein